MDSKRVLLIIPELAMGGAQRSISNLSRELSKNHSVWLLVFNRQHAIGYNHGGELISLDVVPRRGLLNKLLAFIRRVRRLKKIKRDLGIERSISFLEGADYINVLSKSGEKVVLSVRGSKEHDETIHGKYSWLRKKILIPWLYGSADLVVAVNNGIISELKSQYGLDQKKMSVIGNYYNIREITELSNEPKNDIASKLYQDLVLITTGRFAPEKGLKNLVVVFKNLKVKYNNLRMVMVGDGPELNNLITTISQLGLDVHLGLGFKSLPDIVVLQGEKNVFKYLRGATIYLMNSSSEGFPNGLAEAMICDVPVVTSDCPYGPREILEPDMSFDLELSKPHVSQNGVLMPVIKSEADIQLWTETLTQLIENSNQRLELAKNARQRIALFDKDLIISQWHKVIE